MRAPVARIAHLQPGTRRHGPITDHFRANSRDVAAPGPVVRPTDRSQAPEIDKESDQIGLVVSAVGRRRQRRAPISAAGPGLAVLIITATAVP